MKRRAALPILLDDPESIDRLASVARLASGIFAGRIAAAAARGLRFLPGTLRLGRPVSLGHTDAVVAELHADDFPYIVKLRAGRSLSMERESVADACGGISVELRRYLLPPVHVETLARGKTLPDGVLEFALYEHGRAAGGWQSGIASWREIALHSPRLLPESALAVAGVWRTESARLAVKHLPPASSPVYRDKTRKLARASAPPEQPGGERVTLDRYLCEGPPSAFIPDWLRRDRTRREMIGRVLGDGGKTPRVPTAPGFMHGDLHGDNILLHYADDAPSGFSVIDLGTAVAKGCALYDWAKLTLDLVETLYSTPVFLEMPSGRVAERAGMWCGELARRLLGGDVSGERWRTAEESALEAALHLRCGLTPESASGRDLVKVLFLNALFGLRYVSYRNTAWDAPALIRNVVLHASAADAFARVAPGTDGGKKRESGAGIVVPFDLFRKPPGGAFRHAWLTGRRPALIPAGAVDLYLRGISPEPGTPPTERAERLEKAAGLADASGDAFLADCCRIEWADAARNRDPGERHAVLTAFIERPFSATPDSPYGWRERLIAGLAHHYRGVLTATRAAPDMDAALADLARAAALLNASPFALEAARANNSLGHYAGFRHDLARAGQYLDEAWFAREPFDPPWEAAVTLGNLATHARRLGDPRGALAFYQADLALCDPASRDAIEQKAAETRLSLLARERRRGVLADPVLLEAAMTPVRETLAGDNRRGPFWDKCRLMAEVLRAEGGLPADAMAGRALAAGRRLAAGMPGGMDYPSSYALRWLGRLEAALGERKAARRLLKAVLAYWRGRASPGELLSSRLDAEGMADASISRADAARLKSWLGLTADLHGFRRGLAAPPELAWRMEPALRRLERSLGGDNPAIRRDAVREVQMYLEY